MARPKCSIYNFFVGRQEAREEANETFTVPAVDAAFSFVLPSPELTDNVTWSRSYHHAVVNQGSAQPYPTPIPVSIVPTGSQGRVVFLL